jgi:hypothetical protein
MQPDPQLWKYISATEFSTPVPPVSDAARGGVQRLWTVLKGVFGRKESHSKHGDEEWCRPSAELLKTLKPQPDWSMAAALLALELGDLWLESAQVDRPFRVLIGPPGCGVDELLRALARQLSATILEAPDLNFLLTSEECEVDLKDMDKFDDSIIVIPNLERWYFRHEQGLAPVKRLLDNVAQSGRRALIGCDSWAWEFLQHAIAIESLCGTPQAVAPFDAQRLDDFFRSSLNLQAFEFFPTGDEQLVFPDIEGSDTEETPTSQPSLMLKSLAATARGNLGVALALWHELLRLPVNRRAGETAEPLNNPLQTIWVLSSIKDISPEFPASFDVQHRLVLHTVLLHGGLSRALLFKLLPLHESDVRRCTHALAEAGILEEREGRVAVKLTAYPAVRQDLHNEGFLTDTF